MAVGLVVALAVVAALYLASHPRHAATTGSGITMQWLNQSYALWENAGAYPMLFQGQMGAGGYGNIANTNMSTANADIDMLSSLGVQSIRVDMGYAPWLSGNSEEIATDDGIVASIRAHNRSLVLADASSESYRNNPLPWSQFKTAWLQRVTTLAGRYKPDYYLVVKEPGWYVPMVSYSRINPQFQNVSDWLNLTFNLASAVKKVSPNTSVGATISASGLSSNGQYYTDYLLGLEKMQNISVIGFDIYDAQGFNNTMQFLQTYGSGGKQIWIAEAWSTTNPNVAFNSSRAALDSEWINVLYHYALNIHAQSISPFYSDIFASYVQPNNTAGIRPSYYSNRTPVFYEYQKIIYENKNAT